MAQDRNHKEQREREEREERKREQQEKYDKHEHERHAKQGSRENAVAENPETQRRDQQRQQTQTDRPLPDDETFQPGPHIEGTVLREGPEGPRPGTPRQYPAAGDIIMGSPGVDEFEMTRIQMEPHPEASPEIISAPFAQPLPQPDHGIGTEGRRLAEERMGRGHIPNDPEAPLPRIKVDQSPKFPEDYSARDAREAEKVTTGGATQQQNQLFAGQVRPEEGRAKLDVNTPKGEHILGKQDIESRLPRPPLMGAAKIQERRNDTGPGRNGISDDQRRDQRGREHDAGSGLRHRDEERARNERQGRSESGRGTRSGDHP
jgi:hypothetical protein